MGNLYTHIVRRQDARITILSKLKLAWRTKPVDKNLIKKLQQELNNLTPQPISKPLTDTQLQKKYGVFWKKHKPTGV